MGTVLLDTVGGLPPTGAPSRQVGKGKNTVDKTNNAAAKQLAVIEGRACRDTIANQGEEA